MNIKRVFAIVAVLAGFSVPAQAQRPLPVQIKCVKGKIALPDGTSIRAYQAICKHTKTAVNKNPDFKQASSGNRYIVWLYGIQSGAGSPVLISISYAATISDPLSKQFPYFIVSLPFAFETSDVKAMGEAIIEGGLPTCVDAFSDYVDEINSSGTFGREPSEEYEDEIIEKVKFEIDKTFKEKIQK